MIGEQFWALAGELLVRTQIYGKTFSTNKQYIRDSILRTRFRSKKFSISIYPFLWGKLIALAWGN